MLVDENIEIGRSILQTNSPFYVKGLKACLAIFQSYKLVKYNF